MRRFLAHIPSDQIFITDFAFHSIGVILSRLKQTDALLRFVQDVFMDGDASLVYLLPQDMPQLVSVMAEYHLDFDDAYQYVAAEQYDLILVSLDKQFDQTARGRKAPIEIADHQE